MFEQGYPGRKGQGGFYRLSAEGGQKIKEVRDLATGLYHPEGRRRELTGLDPTKPDLKALVMHQEAGAYAWAVLSDTLSYAASLVPEIADGIAAVDLAMRKGYNWKNGPFEMIDELGVDWFIGKLAAERRAIPRLLEAARGKSFYITVDGKRQAIGSDGKFTPVVTPEGYLTLEDVKRRAPAALASNNDASLWDMGDGIACLELTTKDNVITPDVVKMISDTVKLGTGKGFKGLVIGNDSDTFSAGADLRLLREAAQPAQRNWTQINDAIKEGQHVMQGLKYAAVPGRVGARRQGAGGRLRAALAQRCHPGACQFFSRPGRAGRRARSGLGRLHADADASIIPGGQARSESFPEHRPLQGREFHRRSTRDENPACG